MKKSSSIFSTDLHDLPPWLVDLIPPVIFAAWLCILGPWWTVYEFDPDEGFNLMKAALVSSGYPLYTEVWSDQPPVFTILLSKIIGVFGFSVVAARCLSLFFSCVLLWSLFRVLRRLEGYPVAWLTVGFIGLGFLYQKLSVSVMVGLPAIAFAVLALDQLLLNLKGPKHWRLFLSAGLMAVSLQTKFFTFTLLPTMIYGLLMVSRRGKNPGEKSWQPGFLPLLLEWLAGLFVVFYLIGLAANMDFARDILAPHLGFEIWSAFPKSDMEIFWSMVTRDWYYCLMVPAALFLASPDKQKNNWLPLLWIIATGVVLFFHKPIWYHHALLVIIPFAWLAGMGFMVLWDYFSKPYAPDKFPGHKYWIPALLILLVGFPLVRNQVHNALLFNGKPEPADVAAFNKMHRYAQGTRWVVTDRPIDAFYNELLTPPPLAVYSWKRTKSGKLSPEDVLGYLEEYKPEQVSFRRLPMDSLLLVYLNGHYIRQRDGLIDWYFVLPELGKKSLIFNAEAQRTQRKD